MRDIGNKIIIIIQNIPNDLSDPQKGHITFGVGQMKLKITIPERSEYKPHPAKHLQFLQGGGLYSLIFSQKIKSDEQRIFEVFINKGAYQFTTVRYG